MAVATATVFERTLVALTSQKMAKATGPTLQLYTEFHTKSLKSQHKIQRQKNVHLQ